VQEGGTGREEHFDALMEPVDHRLHVPAALLDPPAVAVIAGASSHLQVPYAEVHGWRALRLDVHLPDLPGGGPWPVVVHVHGGSFLTGMPGLGPWTDLPGRGIAVVSVGYRFAAEASFPAPVEDVRAALAWVAARSARYDLDPSRLALWGGSAGGYLAALVAVTGTRILGRPPRLIGVGAGVRVPRPASVVTQYALTDPTRLQEDALSGSEDVAEGLLRATAPFFADSQLPRAVLDHLEDAAQVPPFLVMHGDVDRRVGVGQGRRLDAGLVRAGVRSRFVEVPGADHGTADWSRPAVVDEVVSHLREHWSSR
jgi:acetyl esterase/lipase